MNEIEAEHQKLEKDRQRKIRQADLDIKTMLGRPEGRRVLAQVMFEYCGAFRREDGPVSDFKQGMKQVGYALLDRCKRADATATMEMLSEELKDE
jgi:hypothetical protein